METVRFDVIVIGSGPAGHVAAVTAARAGRSVLVIERDKGVGGACVQRGTIPSKTLRETAAYFAGLRLRARDAVEVDLAPHQQLRSLMTRMETVVEAHSALMSEQLQELGVEQWHGRARFVSPHELDVMGVRGVVRRAHADFVIIAAGSRPRTPPEIPVDHEHVLDSDSILSTMYLPQSLAILGGGVIASEYATIFAVLGVQVVMLDKYPQPLGFLDADLSAAFVKNFEGHVGCRFLGGREIVKVAFDGVSRVVTELQDGEVLRTEKMLCALGRVANLEDLHLDAAGLQASKRGVLQVDQHGRTAIPGVYAAGDVIGPPSLASSSKEQGRRAVCHALGLPEPAPAETIPIGIYTIPEIAAVGLTTEQARERHGDVLVGRASFAEVPRGLISGNEAGFVKLIADRTTGKLLGAHVFGEGATEIIHVAQMALLAGQGINTLADTIFNFPTLAEAYQLAALDAIRQGNRTTVEACR